MPNDAPKEALFALHEFLGIDHGVIVHTASHGTDNSATEEALGVTNGAYRGVALVPVDVSDAELKRLNAAGFRGARFHYMGHLAKAATIDEVVEFSKRLANFDWHLQIHMAPELIGELSPAIKRSATPVTIDHMGRIDASLGIAKKLVADFGDRCIWGTDWPHPNHSHIPDDGVLVDILSQIAPTPAALQALMVDNPMRFYKFGSPMRRASTPELKQ